MTIPDFEKAIKTEPQSVVEFLQNKSEKERKELASTALDWHKKWWDAFTDKTVDGVPREVLAQTTGVAVLGTASLAQIKKKHFLWTTPEDYCFQVIDERRPSWLADWAEWILGETPIRWRFVRRLEKAGLFERPDTPFYTLGFIVAAAKDGAFELLTNDPELFREVPLLFEVEGSGENSLAAFDKYHRGKWADGLKQLSEDGQISRDELLTWSLEALKRDFANFRSGWYSRFHESLKPTDAERVEHQELYLDLLHSQIEPTVSFALKALCKIAKKTKLSQEKLRYGLEAVCLSSKKGTANLGLRLAETLQSEEHKMEYWSQTLLHPHIDIVTKSLQKMKKLYPEPVEPWSERLAEYADELAPSIQEEFRAWLGQDSKPTEVSEVATEPAQAFEVRKLVPCSSVEEVCQLAARVLESMDSPWDIELLLDGMLRFPNPEAAGLSAVKKRAAQRVKSRHFTFQLAALVLTWLGEPHTFKLVDEDKFYGFLLARLQEVQALLADPVEGRNLLSLPSTELGYLEAEELWKNAHLAQERPLDFIQGLLRLKPDTTFALSSANDAQKILSYALGGKKPKSATGVLKKLVSRVRKGKRTSKTWNLLDAAEFYRHFSGPFDWSWIVTPKQHKYDGKVYHYFKFELPLEYTKEPFLAWSESQYESRIEWRRWESIVCPAAREAWLCRGIDAIASNLDWHSALWADTAFLEGLQESSASWGRVEARLACFGLGCKEKGQFGLSLELVAEALKRGQIGPAELGEALADCANSQMIKMNRWAKAISELALIAPLPALCQAWELFLTQVEAKVDIGKLLPSLLQVATQAQHHFSSQESRTKLESYQGKNAAGKAAVKLLKL